VWIVAGRLIELCAMCTLDSTSWMTRQGVAAQEQAAEPASEYRTPITVALTPSEELQGD
jgi:hypothetical protein